MLRNIKFIMSLQPQEETYDLEVNFKHFQTLEEYDSTKEYILIFDHEFACWDVYEILPK